MKTRKTKGLPVGLRKVLRRFERWREIRRPHEPTPEVLWSSAMRLAARHGVSKVVNTLGLNYQALQRRMAANSDSDHRVAKKRIGPRKAKIAADNNSGVRETSRFIELPPLAGPPLAGPPMAGPSLATGGRGECCVELEDGRGAVMRVRFHGAELPDLAALGRIFWNRTAPGNERS